MPSSAASVSTFVVSWKEAAERNESVAERGLGDPEDDLLGLRRLAASGLDHRSLIALQLVAVDELARQAGRCRPSGRPAPS